MASTFLSLHYHFVFSTKNRRPMLDLSWRNRVHEYLSATIASLDGFPQGCGGVADDVHILFGLKATHCLADVMRELKKSATFWIQETFRLPDFTWQEGYSAFTVSATQRKGVQRYIMNQENHHRELSFRDELKNLLMRANIPFEDRFLD